MPLAFVVYYLVAERILEDAASFVVRFLELGDRLLDFTEGFDDFNPDQDFEDSSLDFPDEYLLYVWGLVSSLQNEIVSNKKYDIYVIVVDDGYPVEIYPYPPNEQSSIDLDDAAFSEEKAFKAEIKDDRTLFVYIPLDVFEKLGKACEKGDGEKVRINDEKEALSLFMLAKVLASALGNDDERLNSYIAYKTILKLKRKGLLTINENFLENLPLGDSRTKLLIKRQVSEELGLKNI